MKVRFRGVGRGGEAEEIIAPSPPLFKLWWPTSIIKYLLCYIYARLFLKGTELINRCLRY